jgi:sugar lactone lactonase YvrE
MDFTPLNDVRCELGEGPVYDERRDALWYCDITGKALHRVDLATRAHRQWPFASEVASCGIAESGRLVIALRDVVGMFDPDTGRFSDLAPIERDRPDTRLNDGTVGPDGAFWVGTMDDSPRKEPIGTLYRIDPSGKVEPKLGGLHISNGLAFTADGRRMFHADTRGPWIDRWDFDPTTGEISNRTRIARPDEATGRPDGGATDAEGCYWSAGVSAACLNRFTADGELVASYPLPVAAPTMPCFGGKDLRTLFVTSLRHNRPIEMLARYPLTGITIMAKSPVAGVPANRFRDV